MILGLTGLAGSGKDTVAALLAMKGFVRYAFADEVRGEVATTLDVAQGVAKFVATADDLFGREEFTWERGALRSDLPAPLRTNPERWPGLTEGRW